MDAHPTRRDRLDRIVRATVRGALARYRASGADLPFHSPDGAHGVAMEGYFWRFTDPVRGRVLIALIGVQQSGDGSWALVGLGASGGFWRQAVVPRAYALPEEVGAGAPGVFAGDAGRVVVDLGEDARLDVTLRGQVRWPAGRPFGGSSWFQSVPGLNQYWHPWLLGAGASGTAVVGGREWQLDGAQTYAEKNWGRAGFPETWWWGQAHGFAEPAACVAFAGGQVRAGPLHTEVTGLVVRLPDGELLRLGNPGTSPVRAEVSEDRWRLRGRSARWAVDVDGRAPLSAAHILPVPLLEERGAAPGALEHLTGSLTVSVRRRGVPVWQGSSALAGLEHGGLGRAAAEQSRRDRLQH